MGTRSAEQHRLTTQVAKSRDVGPELIVHRLLHSLGYRYRPAELDNGQ